MVRLGVVAETDRGAVQLEIGSVLRGDPTEPEVAG